MQSLTINMQNEQLYTQVLWLLEHFKGDGLEIVEREDIADLKALAATRHEDTVSFDEYLQNAH